MTVIPTLYICFFERKHGHLIGTSQKMGGVRAKHIIIWLGYCSEVASLKSVQSIIIMAPRSATGFIST